MGGHFLLQEIFPTQESNPGLPHCGQTLYSEPPGKPQDNKRINSPLWAIFEDRGELLFMGHRRNLGGGGAGGGQNYSWDDACPQTQATRMPPSTRGPRRNARAW